MKEIPLTQGKVALVDDADYEYLMQWKWYFCKKKDGTGYARRKVYSRISAKTYRWKSYWMHREIMKTPEGMDTDHRDGNKLNNQKYNLRICTNSQNQSNKRTQRNNTSTFKGVWKSGNKWTASINVRKKRIHLGSYIDKSEAAKAYNAAALEHHGEFARLNDV
jgi:hypothetical protein